MSLFSGECVLENTKRKLKTGAGQVSKKISIVEGHAVYLLKMWGMEIVQQWTKQEVLNRKYNAVFLG